MGIASFLNLAVKAGTSLLFATLGEILSEKVGHLNLGVEGLMQIGAVIGFIVGFQTGHPLLAVLFAALAGSIGALIYALVTITFKANQVVTGLSLTIFGVGFANFFGSRYVGKNVPQEIVNFFRPVTIPGLGRIPFIGEVFFQQSFYVYLSYLCVILLALYLRKTRWGLNTRFIGENPVAAEAGGINVTLYKYANIWVSGCLCGLGGGFLSLVYMSVYPIDVVAGQGWIAVALVIFSVWSAPKAMAGAYFFGALRIVGTRLQHLHLPISVFAFTALPYIATIVVLILTAMNKRKENKAPAWLGINYFREDR